MTMQKRTLVFDSFDQVVDEIRKLQQNGYTATGNWNLSQVCGHLNAWMSFPMDGFPKPNFVIATMLWAMKVSIGRRSLKKILNNGFSDGTPTMPESVKQANEQSDDDAADALVATIDRLKCHNGSFHPSPLFGHLTKEETHKLQLAHCAQHLGFLIPNG